jgi:DNA-binding IclR family transcriptional regulator
VSRNVEQVARAIHWSATETDRLLRELERDGLVERAGNDWQLTVHAERRYGQALRNLGLYDGESPRRLAPI